MDNRELMSQVEHPHAVSREEFEAHRRQVSQDIAGLADAIKEEGRQRSFDTQTLRKDIKDLTGNLGKPQYQALTFAFGVFSFVCLAISAVYAWGADARWDHQKTELEMATLLQGAKSEALNDAQQCCGPIRTTFR